MDNLIENVFYNEIIPECKNGNLKLRDFSPAIKFDTIIENNKQELDYKNPILVINDKKRFNAYLTSYVKKAIMFYYNGNFTKDNIKAVLAYAFINATSTELSNPILYLNRRINFFDYELDNYYKEDNFNSYKVFFEVNKTIPLLEAPYVFKTRITDGNDEYFLPQLYFGIDNDTAYVYAIQNKNKNSDDKLRKKINRMLFKFNNKYVDDNDSALFNGKDVTMSFIATIIFFLRFLKESSINKLKVVIGMPIRYNSHYEAYERRLKYHISKMSKEEYEAYKNSLDISNKAYDDNVNMKLIRNFYRVSQMGDVLKITDLPLQIDSTLSAYVNNDGTFKNDLCNLIYDKDGNRKNNYK